MVKKDMEQENAQNQNNKDNLIKIIKIKVEQVGRQHQEEIMHGEEIKQANKLLGEIMKINNK